MIYIELTDKYGEILRHTYSDIYVIKKIGTDEIYTEAYDLLEKDYKYEETSDLLPVIEEVSEYAIKH